MMYFSLKNCDHNALDLLTEKKLCKIDIFSDIYVYLVSFFFAVLDTLDTDY